MATLDNAQQDPQDALKMRDVAEEMISMRAMAMPVFQEELERPGIVSARQAARCMLGVTSLVARKWDAETMRDACRALINHDEAWTTCMGKLPVQSDGTTHESVTMLAICARGVLPMAGVKNMRAALAFWAIERDVANWALLVG